MQDRKNEFINADGSINYARAIEAGRNERSMAAHAFLRRCSEALGRNPRSLANSITAPADISALS